MSDSWSSSSSVDVTCAAGRWLGIGMVVAHDQFACKVVAADQLLELQLELTAVGAEFDHVLIDFEADPSDHLQPLHDRHHVAQRDEVLDLGGRQLPAHFVEPGLVALQRRDGLIGPRQDGRRNRPRRAARPRRTRSRCSSNGSPTHRDSRSGSRCARRSGGGCRIRRWGWTGRAPVARWPERCGCRRWTSTSAPSIFDSSRSRVGANRTSSENPPSHIDSTRSS